MISRRVPTRQLPPGRPLVEAILEKARRRRD